MGCIKGAVVFLLDVIMAQEKSIFSQQALSPILSHASFPPQVTFYDIEKHGFMFSHISGYAATLSLPHTYTSPSDRGFRHLRLSPEQRLLPRGSLTIWFGKNTCSAFID